MFFFTYIKGKLVDEWVTNAAVWLQNQVFQNYIDPTDEWLWNEIHVGFNRQFTNTLEQEHTRNELQAGIKMNDNVAAYVAKFETLVRKAGYDLGDYMVIQVFTNGLPTGLYEKILTIDNPHTYEDWRQCVLRRQEEFLHMKARREALDKMYGKKELQTALEGKGDQRPECYGYDTRANKGPPIAYR